MSRYGVPESFEALARHRLVLYDVHMHRYGVGLRWLEDYRCAGTVITRVDNFQSAAQLMLLDRGIGSLPCYDADRNPALQRVFPDPFTHHECYLVYHVSLRDTARIRAALEVLTAALASLAESLSGGPATAERTSRDK